MLALRAAGCVYAEDEAAVIWETYADPAARDRAVADRATGRPLEQVVGWAAFGPVRVALAPGRLRAPPPGRGDPRPRRRPAPRCPRGRRPRLRRRRAGRVAGRAAARRGRARRRPGRGRPRLRPTYRRLHRPPGFVVVGPALVARRPGRPRGRVPPPRPDLPPAGDPPGLPRQRAGVVGGRRPRRPRPAARRPRRRRPLARAGRGVRDAGVPRPGGGPRPRRPRVRRRRRRGGPSSVPTDRATWRHR